MPYPFVLSYNGDHFARINHDGVWTIDWDKTENVSKQQQTDCNTAIIKIAVALLAAKGNIENKLRDWAESVAQADQWNRQTTTVDVGPAAPDDLCFTIVQDGDRIAKITSAGNWRIAWSDVKDVADEELDGWRRIALVGFCRLLVDAKDQLKVEEWDE